MAEVSIIIEIEEGSPYLDPEDPSGVTEAVYNHILGIETIPTIIPVQLGWLGEVVEVYKAD
jgi:hypothetical protein